MLSGDKFFGNPFDDVEITTTRLFDFGTDTLNKLTQANGAPAPYTDLINLLTPKLAAVGTELGDVDTSVNIRVGKTMTVDGVIAAFKTTMSEQEGVIAAALGGKATPAFIEFYPQGVSEYRNGTKTAMPTLVSRVFDSAVKYATPLGATLTTLLKSYETSYNDARNAQQQQKGAVNDNRAERTDARIALELALTTTVHTIGAMFPGNVQQCMAFFSFNMLLPQTQHKHTNYTGTVKTSETVQVLNRTLKDSIKITLTNPDDNAAYIAFLAATANAQPTGQGIEVAPGASIVVKPSQLGSLNDTFLLIKNLSAVNDAAYAVELVG